MNQIKAFLRSFNACVKEKLIHPEKRNIDPALLSDLERNTRFNEAGIPAVAAARPAELAAS